MKRINPKSVDDLPKNERVFEENHAGTCRNEYLRMDDDSVFVETFYRFSQSRPHLTYTKKKFNDWRADIYKTAKSEGVI